VEDSREGESTLRAYVFLRAVRRVRCAGAGVAFAEGGGVAAAEGACGVGGAVGRVREVAVPEDRARRPAGVLAGAPRRAFVAVPPDLPAFASISATASSSVIESALSRSGIVALTSPCFTYGP
jgi:hypothetical protein